MVLVQIDVPKLRDAASRMTELAGTIRAQKQVVSTAAMYAHVPTPDGVSEVNTIATDLDEAAEGLNARVDLAVVVNGGDEGALNDGLVSYEVNIDSTYFVKEELGTQLGEFAASIEGLDGEEAQERMELLRQQMENNVSDEQVMAAMYDELGPDGTIDLTALAGDLGFDREDLNEPFVQMLKDGLETASRAWTEEDATAFGRQMVEHATTYPDHDEDGYTGSGRTLALSFLTYDSSLSGAFLTGAADGIDEAERNGDVPGGYWNMQAQGAFSSLWRMFDEDDIDGAYDPMVSVFGSLANHPEDALEWFNRDDDRREYWIKDRAWGHDDFRALGEVLNAATTDPDLIYPPYDENGDPRPEALEAAELASATVSLLPDNGGWGFDDGGMFGGDSWGGLGAAGDFGHILRTYMPSIAASLDRSGDYSTEPPHVMVGTENDDAHGTIPIAPLFNRSDLEQLIPVLGQSDAGFEQLRLGASEYGNHQISLAANGSDPSGTLPDTLTGLGKLEGFMAYNIGGGHIEEAKATDERRQAWVDLGSDLAGAIPVPGGDAVGFVVDQGLSLGTDAVGDAVTGNEGREKQEQSDMARTASDAFRIQALQVLAENDALPELDDRPGVENGELMSPSQIAGLSEQERAEVRDSLLSLSGSQDGLGQYASPEELQQAFAIEFERFFED